VKRIVCDTGPQVYLFEANLLNLLEAAGQVLMPPGVANEVEGVAPISGLTCHQGGELAPQ
jgi:hypothetical protein